MSSEIARVRLLMDPVDGDEKAALPFIAFLISNLYGDASPRERTRLDDREPEEVATEEDVKRLFRQVKPSVQIEVPDHLSAEPGQTLRTTLTFKAGLETLTNPALLAQEVEPVRRQLALRKTLAALRYRLQNNPDLADKYFALLQDGSAARGFVDQLDERRPSAAGASDLMDQVINNTIANTEQK